MGQLQQAWRFVLGEPFTWLYYYFFKTNTFMNEFEIKDRATRLKLLLRLVLPMFLVSYPPALLLSLIATLGDFHFDIYLLLEVAIGVLSGLLVGAIWDMVMNRPVGILGGMWFSIWLGMWAAVSWSFWIAILIATVGGVALGGGVVKSVNKITIKSIEVRNSYLTDYKNRYNAAKPEKRFKELLKAYLEICYESIGIAMLYLIGGATPKFEQNQTRRIGLAVARCIIVSTIGLVIVIVIGSIINDPLHIMGSIWWAITIGSLNGILASVTLSRTSNRLADWGIGIGSGIGIGAMLGNFQQPTVPAIAVALTPAMVTAIAWAITMTITYKRTNIASNTRKTNLLIFSAGIVLGITAGLLAGGWAILLFPLCYSISYWQLPLWLLSFFSIRTIGGRIRMCLKIKVDSAGEASYEVSYENPSEVFVQLRASSIYWDEWEVLPVFNPSGYSNLSVPGRTSTHHRLELGPPVRVVFRPRPGIYFYRPGLDDMMELAVEQDSEQTKEILTFIEAERPLHFAAAQSGASTGFLELIDQEREKLKTPHDIFEIIKRFIQLQPLAIKLDISNSPEWLAFLQDMLELVIEQDIEQAGEIYSLIKPLGSSPLAAAQVGLHKGFLRLVAREMEPQKTLRDISETMQQFTRLQALLIKLNASDLKEAVSDLGELLALLESVCLDASHYLNSLGWQARHDALQNMITNLRNSKKPARIFIPSELSFLEETTRHEADELSVIDHWEGAAQHELDKLQQEPRKTDQINNPYVVGQALQPGTSLFVGRQDLVQQLEQGLVRESHRLTFFLNGERRMGKSSTLRQLPFLLDTRHFLPIYFDLQAPEMTSSITAFLGTIAEKMSRTVETAGMKVEPLVNKLLQEARRENEAAVYFAFNEWLKQVESVLEQNDCIILLSFDEFENLEIAGRAKYLNLHLLLNWFRSVIQNRPQLALLFCGGKSVSEIGQETGLNWSGYFVNVQTFKLSFLREAEARHLITQPVPDYPIEQIFGTGVVDEIIRVTSCHPFLVQAICSNLVNNLNVDSRNRAEIQDVTVAVTQVIEEWEDSYFHDLWTRSDPDQQTCLIALTELGKDDVQHITQYIHRNKEIMRETLQSVRHTLQILLKRDLVSLENETYQIAAPIFNQWVERRVGSNS